MVRLRRDRKTQAAGMPATGPGGTAEGKGWHQGTQQGRRSSTSGVEALVYTVAHCPEQCLAQSKCLITVLT